MKYRIGAYVFELPPSTEVKVKVAIPPVDNFGEPSTSWQFLFGAFSFFVHLEASNAPSGLRDFILGCTKQYVDLTPVEINEITGFKYGDYDRQRSWIDWWMKKGDLMICINLQGDGLPSDSQRETHRRVIESLTYATA